MVGRADDSKFLYSDTQNIVNRINKLFNINLRILQLNGKENE